MRRHLAQAGVLSLAAERTVCSVAMVAVGAPQPACERTATFAINGDVYCRHHAAEEALSILLDRATARVDRRAP